MREVVNSFPLPIDAARLPRVFHLGYHAAASFGATPYLLCMPDGTNAMVDAPRFSSKLAKALEARGGVQLLLLSHMDDVADHNRWKERFPEMVRVMHARDVRGPDRWPYIDMRGVERQLEGAGPWELRPGLRAIHTPGHSAGSVSYLAEAALCGGAEGAPFTYAYPNDNAEPAAGLLGWSHIDSDQVGNSTLFEELGASGASTEYPGATGFEGPLGPGEYSFWLRQGTCTDIRADIEFRTSWCGWGGC